MGESWIVSNLNAALSTWNDKLAEIWSLLTESPQTFKGGQVWGVMTGIHGALQAIGYGLLVLFFAVGVMKTCGSFVEVKKPEHALKLFIRFALAKGAVTYGLELMLAVFSIVQGMVSTIITQSGSSGMSSVSLPQELIDAMDRAYGDERNPIVSKSEFVLSLFEQLIGDGMVTAKEKSILGRCTEQVYLPYIRNGYKGTPPTLQDFYRLLQMQPEPEAQGLALSSELFITGTLNTFARHTNVDTQARIIAYDIRELGEQLMPLGMLVTLDAIYNRVIQNWKKGRRTWIFCDEFYILFRYEYSANFFYKLWKRIRKYNGLVTGLTQNVDELLRSDTARLMLANSEFLVMLNQSATDREELAKLLNISDNQLGYVTNVPAGCGLIRCAGNIVPFTNSFPRNTKLYKLMSTTPSEKKE